MRRLMASETRLPSSPCASRHCRDDADFVTSREGSFDALAIANVLAVDEDVHEPAKLPRVITQSLANSRMSRIEGIEDLCHARPGHGHLGLSARKSAQRSWYEHGDLRVVLHDSTPNQVNVSRDPRARSSDSVIPRRNQWRRCRRIDPRWQALSQAAR